MENIKRKQTLPKIPNQVQLLHLAKPNCFELPICPGSSKLPFLNICQRQWLVKQSNKYLEFKIGLNKL